MKSIVIQLDDPKSVSTLITKIKESPSKLKLSPMSVGSLGRLKQEGKTISNDFNRLLIIGSSEDIAVTLDKCLGQNWKSYVIQGKIETKE